MPSDRDYVCTCMLLHLLRLILTIDVSAAGTTGYKDNHSFCINQVPKRQSQRGPRLNAIRTRYLPQFEKISCESNQKSPLRTVASVKGTTSIYFTYRSRPLPNNWPINLTGSRRNRALQRMFSSELRFLDLTKSTKVELQKWRYAGDAGTSSGSSSERDIPSDE
jgi:hypothetical protein